MTPQPDPRARDRILIETGLTLSTELDFDAVLLGRASPIPVIRR